MSHKLSVITGAAGHIGYALLKELEKNGENVRILIRKDNAIFDGIRCEETYGDITDIESLEKAFCGADVVYHLAGIIDINADKEDIIWEVNFGGTKNVVEACKRCGVKRLVYTSSVDAIPPLPDNELITEIDRFEPEGLDGTYAKTKAAATQYVLDSRSDGFEVVVCHPGACIGPYDYKISNIGEMVRMFINGRFPVSLDFGEYNFVDVRDVAKALYNASTMGRDGECYILTGERLSVDGFIHLLAEKLGEKAPSLKLPLVFIKAFLPMMEIYYKASKTTPFLTEYSIRKLMSNCNFSYAKAERELDFNPMTTKQSLSDMVDWIRGYEAEKQTVLKK